jgi:membrane associated rhomboid family serine protease
MTLQLLFFVYQTVAAVNFIRLGHPEYWPSHAFAMIGDALMGTSVRGPVLMDFGYSNALAQNQPHRFLTSGFLHGGILHLLVNLDTMRRQPSWLETGLGAPLYVTTFLISVVGGNLAHFFGINDPFDRTLVLGASGGICGLYGLMYGSLVRMGNAKAASRIVRGMAIMIVSGFFVESISSMSHIGGFLCGVAMSIFFSPSYRKDYSMRRKNSAEFDAYPRDFRQVMGFGVMPTERGMLPLSLLWAGAVVALVATRSEFRQMPALVAKGLLFPGSLTW